MNMLVTSPVSATPNGTTRPQVRVDEQGVLRFLDRSCGFRLRCLDHFDLPAHFAGLTVNAEHFDFRHHLLLEQIAGEIDFALQ